MSEKISDLDSGIRVIHFLRRLGSIIVVGIFFLLLLSAAYHQLKERFLISSLQEIRSEGVSTMANVSNEYEVKYANGIPKSIFKYDFKVSDKLYEGQYKLHGFLPKHVDDQKKLFTVHYLKDDPDENSLNLEDEINRVERSIEESSIFWLILKILGFIILGLILLGQIFAFISEIKDFNKPIEVPEYLKK